MATGEIEKEQYILPYPTVFMGHEPPQLTVSDRSPITTAASLLPTDVASPPNISKIRLTHPASDADDAANKIFAIDMASFAVGASSTNSANTISKSPPESRLPESHRTRGRHHDSPFSDKRKTRRSKKHTKRNHYANYTFGILSTAVLIFIFIQQIIYNYTSFHGRCVSPVLYPSRQEIEAGPKWLSPLVIELGYGACEHNLEAVAQERGVVGKRTSDNGWPKWVRRGRKFYVESGWDTINVRTLNHMGALDTNLIRNYGEVFRVFWSMNLHQGVVHVGLNILSQISVLWLIEPAFGFWRCFGIYFSGGLVGNLISAVCSPCGVTVGSSGAMYGLLGGTFIYAMENWNNIPFPCMLGLYIFLIVIVGLLSGLSSILRVDNFAHIGGFGGGIFFALMTMTNVDSIATSPTLIRCLTSKWFGWLLPKGKVTDMQRSLPQEAHISTFKEYYKAQIRLFNRSQSGAGNYYSCSFGVWTTRIISGSTLLAGTIVLWMLLLYPPLYPASTEVGFLKFGGMQYCFCCFIKKQFSSLSNLEARAVPEGAFWCFVNDTVAKQYCGSNSG